MFTKRLLPLVMITLSASFCFADYSSSLDTQIPKQDSQTQYSSINNSNLTDSIIRKQYQDNAERWGITEQEWQKFEDIKKGPRGYWSPKLDPLTTLGIEAETEAERQRYAELQVQMEFSRAEKELAYQRAYTAAFKRLYPNKLPIENLGKSKVNLSQISQNQRLTLFVKQNCPACDKQVKDLQRINTPVDIYVIDSNNDDMVIRKWATQMGINPKQVLSKNITLNHGEKLWKQIGKKQDQLPVTYVQKNGQLIKAN